MIRAFVVFLNEDDTDKTDPAGFFSIKDLPDQPYFLKV